MAWRKIGSDGWAGSKPTKPQVRKVPRGKNTLVKGSKQQEAIWQQMVSGTTHLLIKALAGTGKTFTVIHGLERLMEESSDYRRVVFIAFNTAIANELKSKVPPGVSAATCHSLLFRAYRDYYQCQVNDDKNWILCQKYYGNDGTFEQKVKADPTLFPHTKKLISLAKGTLLGYDEESGDFDPHSIIDQEFMTLADEYGIEVNGSAKEIFELVRDILEMAADADESDHLIDYDDMIWLPVILNMKLPKYDLLCVDEAQDLNRAQQIAILRMGTRIMLVGDENQSIYGFRGADIESMSRMELILKHTKRKVKVMPLTMTRRCPTSHVAIAKTMVPAFEAMPNAPVGSVVTMIEQKALSSMDAGDLVICRVNAPIVSMAFRLLRMGVKANIQGRDIGQGLMTLIRKMVGRSDYADVDILLDKLEAYEIRERQKIVKKPNNEMKLLALEDKCDCIRALCDGVETIGKVIERIEIMFHDTNEKERNFVLLSSVHRAKGLEAERVFIIYPEKMPHPMARGKGGLQQEMNCKYVAWTRSKNTIVLVPEGKLGKRED